MAETKSYRYEANGLSCTSECIMNSEKKPFYSLDNIQLRFLCPNDLNEVRSLCRDWFPIEYPFYWYEAITSSSNRYYSLAAVYNQTIIGLIVAEIKPYEYFILNGEDSGILAKCLVGNSDMAYILSLGVLKEYRRNGVATLLLDSLLSYLVSNERRRVKAVFLHVLTTNAAAIMFYEKRKFKLHSFLPYYYCIEGRCKDGFMYVLYINGGHGPWTIYDYIKFMCGKIVSGGGLFPWLMNNVNRAIEWIWRDNKFQTEEHQTIH
ncbi:N-alpha-acetyltransferase 60 isoform X2 [Coccinella septempunctata]|uniref:N-alpha-acetyltransferase 60 isoform X2 n=1 Tax=Coccinella septempunctata TaxID=41139 RepID=UPI001D08DCAB|nr:N-alpha-acetyltransferase 60 isoform X2 [Coccinella septempunctata]